MNRPLHEEHCHDRHKIPQINMYFGIIHPIHWNVSRTKTGSQLLIFKKRGFLKNVSILEKKVLSWEKIFFLCQQFQILELKKGFCFKKKKRFFIDNFRFEMWQIPALLQASLDFPQLEGTLVNLWLISLRAQDGALFQYPNTSIQSSWEAWPIKDMVCT